jgi:predicted esterase
MLAAANQAPERFSALLLLAPALMWSEPPVDDPAELLVPPGLTCHILHGAQDAIVPLAVSERLVSRCADRCTLTIVDDTHALRNSMEAIATVLVQLERTLAQSGTIPVPQVR